jgi:hypothetical protein
MGDENRTFSDSHLEVVAKMVRAPVTGGHHKQRDTIKNNWCSGYDGDVIDEAIDDLVAEGILIETARDTIKLRSVKTAKEFIKEHDREGDYTWYL